MRSVVLKLLTLLFVLVGGLAIAVLVLSYGLVLSNDMEHRWDNVAAIENMWMAWFRFGRYPLAVAAASIPLAVLCRTLRTLGEDEVFLDASVKPSADRLDDGW